MASADIRDARAQTASYRRAVADQRAGFCFFTPADDFKPKGA